jgi:hypothetical protein
MAQSNNEMMVHHWLPVLLLAVLCLVLGASEDSQVRSQINQMTDQQKRQLLEKTKIFQNLGELEQQRMRDLHQQLQDAPDREILVDVMKQYSEWLRRIPSETQRTNLLSMPVKERVEAIRRIQREKQESDVRELSSNQLGLEDSRVISLWLNKLLKTYGAEIAESEQDVIRRLRQSQRVWLSRMPDSLQRDRVLAATLVNQVCRSENPLISVIPVADELKELVGQLSERGRELYQAAAEQEQRQQLLARWAFVAALRSMSTVSEEELARFYLEDLSPEDRDDVDHLSGQRFRQVLNNYYLRDKGLRSPFGRRPGPRDPGNDRPPPLNPNRQP